MQFPSESRAKTHIHLQWNIHELNSTLKGLKNLKKYDGQYDRILRNHNALECPLDMLDNVIECCQQILAGTDDKYPVLRGGKWVLAAKQVDENQQRVDGKQGNIFYREDKRC